MQKCRNVKPPTQNQRLRQKNDLSKIEIEKTKELKEKLHQWRKKVGAQMMQPNPDYDSSIKADEFYKYKN